MTAPDSDFNTDVSSEFSPASIARMRSLRTKFVASSLMVSKGEADKMRVLSEVYQLAEERAASMPRSSTMPYADRDKRFAWQLRSLAGELGVAVRDSDVVLRNRCYEANTIVSSFPEWLKALERGDIDLRYIRTLLKIVQTMPEKYWADFGAQLLEYASKNTSGKTTRYAEELAATLAAENYEECVETAREARYVSIMTSTGAGMATLFAYLPVEQAVAIDDLLTKQARILRDEYQREAAVVENGLRVGKTGDFQPDQRTTAQIKADIFADTLLSATPESILNSSTEGAARVTATVNITVPVMSLLSGRVDGSEPALLNGELPMSFEEAKQLTATAPSLQRILTDPITGYTLCVDNYLPPRDLRHFLQVRDATCRFPGCSRPAERSDLDHTIPYSEGGPTSSENLAALCRPHHVQKHQRGWGLSQLGEGVLEFTTPLGHEAVTEPRRRGPIFKPTVDAMAGCDAQRNSGSGPAEAPPNEDDDPPF